MYPLYIYVYCYSIVQPLYIDYSYICKLHIIYFFIILKIFIFQES